jgi:hypothetical protein
MKFGTEITPISRNYSHSRGKQVGFMRPTWCQYVLNHTALDATDWVSWNLVRKSLQFRVFNPTLPVPVAAPSAGARLLSLWVRIPPGAWMSVCCECCMLSDIGLCDELITRPEESYWLWCVVVCDLDSSLMRRPWSTGGGCCAKNRQTNKLPTLHISKAEEQVYTAGATMYVIDQRRCAQILGTSCHGDQILHCGDSYLWVFSVGLALCHLTRVASRFL